MRYSDHLDYLVAAISYLGASGPWARTPQFLAQELNLSESHLTSVFEGFPGLFRKSLARSEQNGQPYFSLQARYARRPDYGLPEKDTKIPPLSPEEIGQVLDFVLHAASAESTTRRATAANTVTLVAASIAAVASVVAVVLSAD